jgi:uncharacterized RDD family membrane protein YckC
MSFLDDIYQISTPENVDFGYEIAGIGSRFLAALLDTLLISILQIAVFLAILFVASLTESLDRLEDMPIWALAILGLVAFTFFWGYYIFFEIVWNGQTPGKRRAGLRVIRADGLPISFAESAIRNLVRLVDFLPAYYGVGVVAMFIDTRSRRLGDLAAGTIVVRDKSQISLDGMEKEERAFSLMVSTAPITAELPVETLTDADLRMAEDFVRRRAELSNRAQLAGQIARHLKARMNLSGEPPDGEPAEEFILQVVRARRERG